MRNVPVFFRVAEQLNGLTTSGEIHGMGNGVVSVDAERHQDIRWRVRDHTLKQGTKEHDVKTGPLCIYCNDCVICTLQSSLLREEHKAET